MTQQRRALPLPGPLANLSILYASKQAIPLDDRKQTSKQKKRMTITAESYYHRKKKAFST